MTKRERLTQTIQGARPDRLPVALWRHFPGDDQRAADLARSLREYQRQFDWDFLVAAPSNTYSTIGYGLYDAWQGHPLGIRDITKCPVERSLHWTELRTLDPVRGELGKQIECLRLLTDTLDNTPIVPLVYSPLAQARRLAGTDRLRQHLRTRADRLRTGLSTITESTLRYLNELARLPIAGIYYVVELADYIRLSEPEYQQFGMPYDAKIFGALGDNWWLNVLHVDGQAPMLSLFADAPVQALSWQAIDGRPSLDRLPFQFDGAIFGGLSAYAHLQQGTPATIRDAARQTVSAIPSRRIILGCGQPVPLVAPLSNLQAVRDVVQQQLTI